MLSSCYYNQWAEATAFLRSDDPNLFPEPEFSRIMPGNFASPSSPDLELFATSMAFKNREAGGFEINAFGLHAVLLR